MTQAPRQLTRLTACLAALAVLAILAAPAGAQVSDNLGTFVPDAPPANAPPGPAYQDHYIANGALAPDVSVNDGGNNDGGGLARSIRIDGVASWLSQSGLGAAPDVHEDGVIINAQWDSASYGTWSADGAARLAGSGERHDGDIDSTVGGETYGNPSFALHERGMPFDGGWQTDNGLGDINTPLINLARQQPRFLLISGPLQGLDTEWRGPEALQFVAGVGEPGVFDGIRVPTFQTLGGTTANLGAQWSPSSHWSFGSEFAAARDVTLYYLSLDNDQLITTQHFSSTTGFATAAWQDASSKAQFNVVDGTVSGASNALGFWADASDTHRGFTNTLGAFRIDPNLAWGDQVMTNDVQGGYYRLGYQSRRWIWDVGVDQVSSVSSNGVSSTFVNGDVRYQVSRDLGVGAVANLLHSGLDPAWSAEGYADRVNAFGSGRVQLDYAQDSQTKDETVTLQQTWHLQVGRRLSTSAAVDHISGSLTNPVALGATPADTTLASGSNTTTTPLYIQPASLDQSSTVLRLAAYGGADITGRLSIDGTVQWAKALAGAAAPTTSADVTASWQLTHAWSVLLSYYENRVGSWSQLVVNSPLAPPTQQVIPAQGARGVFLTVRWQEARGLHFAPLGGAPGMGSGRLTGVVYLDANENGRYDAGESGAPNVTVVLDGRYSVRTDASGRFDFSAVAAGHHVVTVQGDNLPLPWTLVNEGRVEVDVATRDRTDIDIGAVRIK
jgi:SdrD B-like domain